jgi:hypothetical protein
MDNSGAQVKRSAGGERGPGEWPQSNYDLRPEAGRTYIIEFKTADGESLAISVPVSETRVLNHFQERMPYGLFVPDVNPDADP